MLICNKQIYYEEELLVTMYKYYSKFTNVRAIEFIKSFNHKFGMSERNFTIFLTFNIFDIILIPELEIDFVNPYTF